jgi:hypothetical protein
VVRVDHALSKRLMYPSQWLCGHFLNLTCSIMSCAASAPFLLARSLDDNQCSRELRTLVFDLISTRLILDDQLDVFECGLREGN